MQKVPGPGGIGPAESPLVTVWSVKDECALPSTLLLKLSKSIEQEHTVSTLLLYAVALA